MKSFLGTVDLKVSDQSFVFYIFYVITFNFESLGVTVAKNR